MSRLSEMEIKEISDKTKALTEEEIKIILSNIPGKFIYDEMKRRDEAKDEIIKQVEWAIRGKAYETTKETY